jgi:hypothetical protein
MSKLSATGVKQAKAQAKAITLPDGGGMYLLINPNGSKYWRYDYRYAGKRKTLALGWGYTLIPAWLAPENYTK